MTNNLRRWGVALRAGSRNTAESIRRRAAFVGPAFVLMVLLLLDVPERWPGRSGAPAQPAPVAGGRQPGDFRWDVRDFGARGDGKADESSSFQRALDAAGRAGGGTVFAPRGAYRFAGRLNVPVGVTLKGSFESVPAHNGVRDPGLPKPGDLGTALLVTADRGQENAAAFLTLNTDSTLRGVVLSYPDADPKAVPPAAYPYAIAMRGNNPAVLDVELLNAFQGIDARTSVRHLIRNVSGQPLRLGVFVDEIYDIGRIENVHFNPWWSADPKLLAWQQAHGEAFVFGRSDWEYVLNTFCYGYHVGYKFTEFKNGPGNGNFLGIGADDCYRAVLVESATTYGLLITNGEFVSIQGDDPTMIEVQGRNAGTVRLVNCAFWGPCRQIAKIAGRGTVGFGDCTFGFWDRERKGVPAIEAEGGTVLVRGCEFQVNSPQVRLGPGVRRAVIAENVFTGPARIENRSRGNVQIGLNSASE